MAEMVSGSQGGITLPSGIMGDNVVVFSWTGTIEHEKFEATPFESGLGAQTNYKSKSLGMYHMVGTCEGWMLDSAVPAIGTAASLNAAPVAGFRLYTVGSATAGSRKGYAFTAVVGNMAMSVDQKGQATVSLSFESSGAVTAIAD